MNPIPAHIPRSLRSYLELYQDNADETIEKLEKHLKKRGPDAVGFYLLAWFYHHNGNPDMAIKCAWKAKIYAPGSPTMQQLHYYLAHPKNFKAWKPIKPAIKTFKKQRSEVMPHPISDLDSLIDRLSAVESNKIRLSEDSQDGPDLSIESSMVEDIVTETLANIHEKQGNIEAAIETYKRLMCVHTHKKGYYRKQIVRLTEELND